MMTGPLCPICLQLLYRLVDDEFSKEKYQCKAGHRFVAGLYGLEQIASKDEHA